jgi:cyclopropane fatty-acyl-phospholipid synthase-like methyltransferase
MYYTTLKACQRYWNLSRVCVLDLGCGKAVSAIFLAKEFDLQVWAVDPVISSTENYSRIKKWNVKIPSFR